MLEFLTEYSYLGLFLSSFLGATILPLSSEVVLAGVIALGAQPWACVIIATIGNTLGGMTNYYLGRLGKIEWIEKYLKIKKEKLDKMQHWLENKGASMAFFSFLPAIGDIIPAALGFMRANIFIVTTAMLIGKLLRYIFVMYGVGLLK